MKIEKGIKTYKAPVGKECAIYFLMNDQDEVIYVGQSTRGIKKIFSHYDIDYSSFGMVECSFEELSTKEDFYIMKYEPIYNKNLSKNKIRLSSFFASLKNKYKELGIQKVKETLLNGGIKMEVFKGVEIFDSDNIEFAKELFEKNEKNENDS